MSDGYPERETEWELEKRAADPEYRKRREAEEAARRAAEAEEAARRVAEAEEAARRVAEAERRADKRLVMIGSLRFGAVVLMAFITSWTAGWLRFAAVIVLIVSIIALIAWILNWSRRMSLSVGWLKFGAVIVFIAFLYQVCAG